MTVKMMICARRRSGQTLWQHRSHMKDVRGPMVLEYITRHPALAPRRYVQNHGFDGAFSSGDPAETPLALGFDAVTEVWFPDLQTAGASLQTPFYLDHLKPDEPLMVDIGRVIALPYEEVPILRPAQMRGAFKLFVIYGPEMVASLDGVTATYVQSALGCGFVRNTALVPGPIAAIDEFWFADEDSAHRFGDLCRETRSIFGGDGEIMACALVLAKEIVLQDV